MNVSMERLLAARQQIIDEVLSWGHPYLDEDTWFSCAQAVAPDETEPGSGCADDSRAGGPCDCGLAERQARILRPLMAAFGSDLSVELCNEFEGEEGWFSVECQLPKNHAGDHCAVATWPRTEWWIKSAPTPTSEAIHRIWAPTIEQMFAPSQLFRHVVEAPHE